jgi:hypothetical protein
LSVRPRLALGEAFSSQLFAKVRVLLRLPDTVSVGFALDLA